MLQADATFARGNAALLGLRRFCSLRRLNAVQCGVNGAVADGVNRHADAPHRRVARQFLHLRLGRRQQAAILRLPLVGVEHRRRLRAERAVHVELDAGEAQDVVAKVALDTKLQRMWQRAPLDVVEDAGSQFTAGAQPLQEPQRTVILDVVDAGQPTRAQLGQNDP